MKNQRQAVAKNSHAASSKQGGKSSVASVPKTPTEDEFREMAMMVAQVAQGLGISAKELIDLAATTFEPIATFHPQAGKLTIHLGRDVHGAQQFYTQRNEALPERIDPDKAVCLIAMNSMPHCLLDAAAGLLNRALPPAEKPEQVHPQTKGMEDELYEMVKTWGPGQLVRRARELERIARKLRQRAAQFPKSIAKGIDPILTAALN